MNMATNVHYLFDFIGRTLLVCLQAVCPVAAMLDLKGVSFDRIAPTTIDLLLSATSA